MELRRITRILVGGPDEVDPGNYNVQQVENLVGLLFVFKDRNDPLVQYEHWYLYDQVRGGKWPQGTARYTFASQTHPRVTTELSRNRDEPVVDDPSQPSHDAFGFSRDWTEKGITARYIISKTAEQSPVDVASLNR